MSKKREWYQPRLFLRAGKPQRVFRQQLVAVAIGPGDDLRVVVSCKGFVTWRDGVGVPKEFARRTAGVPAHRLMMLAGMSENDALKVALTAVLAADDLGARIRVTPRALNMKDIANRCG